MAKKNVIKIKNYLHQCLGEKGLVVNNIALFGSHLNGNPHAESDIDFIVVSESFTNKDLFERAKMIRGVHFKVIQKFDVPLDILLKTPSEFETMREGKMIEAEVI